MEGEIEKEPIVGGPFVCTWIEAIEGPQEKENVKCDDSAKVLGDRSKFTVVDE